VLLEEFVALDLETTGLNPEVDQITEIGATRFTRDGGDEHFQTLVNPGRAIPPEIEELTGIRNADVADAPRFAQVVGELATFIGRRPVVGQNIKFDITFLSKAGLDLPGVSYDTWEIASVLLPRADHLNLASLAELLGVQQATAHRALADAETARDVFLELLRRFEAMPRSLLLELHGFATTAGWAAASLIGEALERTSAAAVVGALSEEEAAEIVARLRQPLPATPVEELTPQKDRVEILPSEVASVFAVAARRGELFPDYEVRDGQLEMAGAVATHLAQGGQLAVEAGTGTGKSLGYLVPAVLHARRNQDRVVVSTHTINLQEQLAQQDVPLAARLVEAATGEPADELRSAVLKGRSNYLCLDRWTQARLEAQPRDEPEARLFGRVASWLPSTETGDLAELYMTSDERSAWDRISAEGTDCLQRRCSFVQEGSCFLLRSRQRAAGAHIVIVNHALLLANAARDDQLLPPFNHLVVDEAHRLEDVATQHFGATFEVRAVRDLFDQAGPHERHGEPGLAWRLRQGQRDTGGMALLSPAIGLSALADQIEPAVAGGLDSLKLLTETLRQFARDQFDGERPPRRIELTLTSGVRKQPSWEDVEEVAVQLDLALQVLSSRLSAVAETLTALGDEIPDSRMLSLQAQRLRVTAENARVVLRQAALNPGREDIAWLTVGEGDVRLNTVPLDVAPLLQESLWADRESVLATSATLQTGGSFAHSTGRLGMDEAETLVVPSPFDFKSAVLTLLVEDLPEPGMPGYDFSLHEMIADAALAAGGRTLALFTSHAGVRAAAASLREDLYSRDVRVLAQRQDGAPARLLRMLQARPKSLILGTAAFWEGVDVPGDALSQIVIARLPFPVPTDPVTAGRSEQYANPFNDYALPQAVLRFRQGFGRLIRRTTDRGVFIVADSRVARRRYGPTFLESIPETELRRVKADEVAQAVSAWLAR
jgi:DNA polymerase-3 subunit epsilon/ATP-dependent DNA helicase DinG